VNGLRYVSWADNSGYAVAAKGYLRVLRNSGLELTWTPMLPSEKGYTEASDIAGELSELVGRDIRYDTVLVHTPPEYFAHWVERERPLGRRIFGYTVWELEGLPKHWPAALNRLDGVLVPTHANAEAFLRSGVTVPIHVVPHLSQFELEPSPKAEDRRRLHDLIGVDRLKRSPFVFYTIGQWSRRKGLDATLAAYRFAFTAEDPVLLVIKTSARDMTQLKRDWRVGFRRRHPSPLETVAFGQRPGSPKVAVIADETLASSTIHALHELGDCYISLARAEGWGLGTFDAARIGKPVIVTGWGGQAEYLDGDDWRVAYDMTPVREPPWLSSYKADQLWAEPSVADAARKLRSVFANRQRAHESAAARARRIRHDYSAEAIRGQLVSALS